MAENIGRAFVIWSFEHNGWWGPGRMGYTPNVMEAGLYSQNVAEQIVANANRYATTPHETFLRLTDAIVSGPPAQ